MTYILYGALNLTAEYIVNNGRGRKKYKRGFPKPFYDETYLNKDGYPTYQRRNNGRKWKVKGFEANNRQIVPYNPFIYKTYGTHINIKIYTSIQAIKYIYKYVYKGYDIAIITFKNPNNEIKRYINGRYIGA